MDEQRAWIKSRRKRRLRLLAVTLVFCLMFTTYPNILETLSVFAAGTQSGDGTVYVSGFAGLPEEVREQTVPVGTGAEELTLPDTLEAVVAIPEGEALPEDAEEETEDPLEGTGEETESSETEGTETEESADNTQPEQETDGENAAPDHGGNQTEESQGTELEDSEETGNTKSEEEQDTEPEGTAAETVATEDDAIPENSGNAGNSRESVPSVQTEDAELTQETHTVTMPEYQAENVITVETLENTQETGAEEETVIIEGITWQSETAYDGNTEGTYLFTAVLPEGYALMEGVSLPQITVTVQSDSADSAVQALLERIAALPDSEEYLANEPDVEEEETYAEWMEGLYQYAGEALDIQEAYETLTGEQQASVSEEALAKLTAWVEIAMQIVENSISTMATSGTFGNGVTWSFSGNTLTISSTGTGTGAMDDYPNSTVDHQPWKDHKADIKIVEINDGVTSIGNYAFRGYDLTDVTIKGSQVSIGTSAFQSCGELTNLNIMGSVTTIGNNAFKDCKKLQDVTFKDTVSIKPAAFWGCDGLSSITIPDSVTNIGASAFRNCGGLTSVTFQGVTSLNDSAFGDCTNLKTVTFENSTPPTVNGNYFYNCTFDTTKGDGKGIIIPSCKDLAAYNTALSKYKYYIDTTHDEAISIPGTPATCTTAGLTEGKQCSVCGVITQQRSISALGHSPTYSAADNVITQGCDRKCGHSATATLTLDSSVSLTYIGSEITPVIVTYSDNWAGDKPTAISYNNNTAAGNNTASGSLTISGETATLNFSITKATPSYTAPSGLTATYGQTLANVTLPHADNGTWSWKDSSTSVGDVGTHTFTATYTPNDTDNYSTCDVDLSVTVNKKPITFDKITFPDATQYYTGSPVEPEVTVKDTLTGVEKTLVKDTDYTVSYSGDHTNPGEVTVTVTGIGNYTGTFTKNFTIEYRTLPAEKLKDYVTISQTPTNGWYNADITLTPKDGCSVGEMPAGIGNNPVTISQETGTDGSTKTIYIKDGENIYQTEFSYKLDKTPPAVDLTGMTVENGKKTLWDWIIGKTGMIIKIPDLCITETLSGIAEVFYTATPESGGEGKSGTISAKDDGTYEITLDKEFTGTIKLTVKDKAGHATQVTLPADGGKVIAEDYAPVVKITPPDTPKPNENGWYNEKITITVTVTDDKNSSNADIISGGIAEIKWKDGENCAEQIVADLPGNDARVYTKEFTISVNTEGAHTYYVNAVDNAGNESGWQTYTVKVDIGKPVFNGNLTVKNRTKGGADITFIPSEGGKAYWIVSDEGTVPSAQQVKEQSGQKGGVQGIVGGTESSFNITGLTPGEKHTVYVVLEDAAGNLSDVKTESFLTLQKAPDITLEQLTVNYIDETVKLPDGVGDVEVYTDPSDPSGSKITPNADGSLPVTPGTAVYIRYPEKTENGMTVVPASDSVKIDIPGRPDKPAAKEVTVTDTMATVTNPAPGEEYVLVEKGKTPDWSKANTTGQFTGRDPNTEYDLYVRKKATGSSFASEPVKKEIRTSVTIKEPVITGDGAGGSGNTAPKPDAPDAGGAAVTYTGTYSEEYTPVIKIGSQEYTPEMTWNENSQKGSWEYTYPIPSGATKVEITVEFRKRTLTGVTVTPNALTIYADNAANTGMDALTAYVKANSSARAVYDNKTSGTVQAAYAAAGSFVQKGGTYAYTVSAEGKTDRITLTVSPVSASVTAPDKYMQIQKSGGYTAAEVGEWLPAQVIVTYTGAGYTARTENRAVTWNTGSIGSDFGSATGVRTITGTADLPAWATGGNSVSMVIEFVDKIVLKDDQIQLSMPGFSYGTQTLPNPSGSITVTDTNPTYTYLYSTDGGTTWVTADRLPKSDGGYLIPGKYRVKMTYTGDSYTGEKTASFTVEKNALSVLSGTLEAEDKNYDGTVDAELKGGGQPVLSGIVAGDTVTLGGSLSAVFKEKGPKKNIPVTVTGFALEGEDAGYYTLKNTTITLYATINNADGTPPRDNSGNGGGDGNSEDGSNTQGNNNSSGKKTGTQKTPGTAKGDAETGDTENPENGDAVGNTDPLKPGTESNGTDAPGQAGADSAQTQNQQTKGETSQTLQASMDGGRLIIAGGVVATGNITEVSKATTIVEAGDGAVIVTVVCEDEQYTAGVSDTVAVANAVLSPEQIQLVNDGETIEIRVDVTDISTTVPGQDKEVIESGLAECRKEMPDLTLGMYVDISMFIKVGEGGWNAITHTREPVDVVIGIPKELKADGREFYIIRSHDGEYTLLPDLDDNPDTITVSTDMFSAYALVYEQAEGSTKCGLCHICPAFLGICCFIWLTVIIAIVLLIWIVIWRKRKEEKEEREK